MIKRILATMLMALGALSASYAEIQLKDLGDGKVSITFLFKDPSSEMGVIGSFDNWTVPGEAMTKNADGLWEKTLSALATDEIVYKFYTKGTYIFDEQAPDKKDDGYGGFNGLIVVADILSGVTPMKPGAAVAAADGAPAEKVFTSKLNFGTYTIVGSKTTFSTQGVLDRTQKGLEADSTGLFAKSYWKMGGTLLPSVNAWFEIAAIDGDKGYRPIWAQDSRGQITTSPSDSVPNLIGGLLTNPINYLNGGSNPVLNSSKFGIETPIVVWETAYGYAKPTKRTAILWETLTDKDAGGGYMRFDLGSGLKRVGDLTVEANLTPNKMVGGNMGVFGWLGASLGDNKIDLQYDGKSAQTDGLSKVFEKIFHQDYLIGGKTKIAGVDLLGQLLINKYEADFEAKKHLSAELKATWALPNDVFGITSGYRLRGSDSSLLFGNNDSGSFGDSNTIRYMNNVWGKVDILKVGADTSFLLDNDFTAGQSSSYYGYYLKPWTEVTLDQYVGAKATAGAYVKVEAKLRDNYEFSANRSPLNVKEWGAKYYQADLVKGVINGADIVYGYNGAEDNKTMHTLIASLTLPKDATAQIGFGFRQARDYVDANVKDQNNPLAFVLGGSWKLPEPALKTPLVYGAFVYNMDPYEDGANNLKMNDNVPDGGIGKSDGKAQLRLMIKWDF